MATPFGAGPKHAIDLSREPTTGLLALVEWIAAARAFPAADRAEGIAPSASLQAQGRWRNLSTSPPLEHLLDLTDRGIRGGRRRGQD